MITIKNVTKKYPGSGDEIALNDISTSFKEGYIHGIIGVSGAGKSTLIRLFNQLESYDKGTITIFDYTDIKALNKESTRMLRKDIGMVFQTDHLLSRKTVIDNILLPIGFHRPITEEDKKYAYTLLDEVGLTAYKDRYPAHLSGGQRQRVGIARALINHPKLLICDEPTSALDVITTDHILSLIKRLAKKHHLNVLFVTHDMNVIEAIADTVTVMDKGNIIEQGPLEDILFKAKHPKTKAFIKKVGLDLDTITETFDKSKLLLLKFSQTIVKKPILANMVRDIECEVSIVYSNITPNNAGWMIVYAKNNQQTIKRYLREHQVEVDHVI
ncbi:MAG: methionine ABC transporter ATP-binding protein [Candidatus Izemoplasma sp.]|nr:methionine ABC transporter ATP-binding protein [Candidatus Izemoplasma sp.]